MQYMLIVTVVSKTNKKYCNTDTNIFFKKSSADTNSDTAFNKMVAIPTPMLKTYCNTDSNITVLYVYNRKGWDEGIEVDWGVSYRLN